jgi:hypothetical protein
VRGRANERGSSNSCLRFSSESLGFQFVFVFPFESELRVKGRVRGNEREIERELHVCVREGARVNDEGGFESDERGKDTR